MSNATGRLLLQVALLGVTVVPAIAQQPKNPRQPAAESATLQVTARLTRIDVTAQDANGRPLHGLTRSDFTVKEDGKVQQIKNFEDISRRSPAYTALFPRLPPHVYSNVQVHQATTGAVNVLLIDGVTTGLGLIMTPQYLAAAKAAASKYIQNMPDGTQMIILELTDHLRVIQSLSTDRDVMLAALHSIEYRPVIRGSLSCTPGTSCEVTKAEFCTASNTQSQTVVDGLESASAYLSGIQGRKNLIWFTPGIPWLTTPNYRPDYAHEVGCLRDLNSVLQRDYNLLTEAQVALYPIDPGGVAAPFNGRSPDPRDHVSMEDLADSTGGVAYYNSNDLATAISEAIVSGTEYYSLAYTPPVSKYDGQFHKISVMVDRPGIRLVYRNGYTSIDPTKNDDASQKSSSENKALPNSVLSVAMNHGAIPATQILFTLGVTPSPEGPKASDAPMGQLNPKLKLKSDSLVRYNFKYRVLPGDLALADVQDGKRQASVEFAIAAYNSQGELLNVLRETTSFAVATTKVAVFLQQPLPVQLQLDLPRGDIFIRAEVRDVPSNKVGTLEIPLSVP